MIIVDASLLIAHLDSEDALHSAADELLAEVASETLGASHITVAEVLVAPARAGKLDKAVAAVRQLGVEWIPLGDDAPVRLAALRAETNLKLPDCCVILAAEQTDATLATFDARLSTAAENRGLSVVGQSTRHSPP